MSKCTVLQPQKQNRGGGGGILICFLDFPHMVSYYLSIHFIALNAILKKRDNRGGDFKLSGWYL